jgi:hypothetical protein
MATKEVEFDGDERIEIACSYNTIDDMLKALKKPSK